MIRSIAVRMAALAVLAFVGCRVSAPPTSGGGGGGGGKVPNFNGRVLGTVAVVGPERLLVPGARVLLKNRDTGVRSTEAVTTDSNGRYEIPPQPVGRYDVCAEAPGLVSACADEPVEITTISPYAVRDLALVPSGRAVFGRVLLRDGSVCYHPRRTQDTEVRALVSAAGSPVVVQANLRGEYVLGGLSGAGGKVTGRCQGAEVSRAVAPGSPELAGNADLDLVVPAARPVLRHLSVRHGDGTGARSGRSGETITAAVDVSDPDKLPLTYRWSASVGAVAPGGSATSSWRLPSARARGLITVEVSNGRGGFVEGQLALRVGPPGERFLGTVTDGAGAVMAGIPVVVDGKTVSTDERGRFLARTDERERHVISIHRVGYAPVSRVYYGGNGEVRLVLRPATRVSVNPKRRAQVRDAASRVRLDLQADSLVDQQGAAPAGPVEVHVSGFDPHRFEELPGDRAARDAQGNDLAVSLTGAISIDISDGAGRRYQLAPGKHAGISLSPPPGAQLAALPRTLTLLHYDEAAATWVVAGALRLAGNHYDGSIKSFSVWAGGQVNGKWSCTVLTLDPELLGKVRVRSSLQYHPDPSVPYQDSTVVEFTPTSTINAITHLPEWTSIDIQLLPLDNPDHVFAYTGMSTMNAVVKLPLEYPYTDLMHGCNSFAYFSRFDVLPSHVWLDQFKGDDAGATAYYQKIGAIPGKDTYAKWKSKNGITAADESKAVDFYNAQELGLGRKTYCRQNGSDPASATLACCVTKYGEVGGSVSEALQDTIDDEAPGDTVCMEYAPPAGGGARFARFYIYGPDGKLQNSTHFDTSGSKYVPEVCMHCHGRTREWKDNGGDMGGNFVFLDAASYQFRDYTGPRSLDGQQERFRKLNQMVLMTHTPGDPYAAFIHSLYPAGIDNAGSKAREAPVLTGWNSRPDVYQDVVKPNCRTCHMWQSFVDFKSLDLDIAGIVQYRFCSGSMPNAMNPTLNIWKSLDPFLGDLLLGAFKQPLCFHKNQVPTVTITQPADNTKADFGGFGMFFTAKANDSEDGNNCCHFTWVSDKDGVMGYGKSIYYSFGSPGMRKITALAGDSDYGVGKGVVHVTLQNRPPAVKFVLPSVNNQSFYKGIPYVLHAEGSDNNQIMGLDCSSIGWKSSNGSDPFPQTGCFPEVTFGTNGARTLTVKATDPQGATDSKSLTVNVPDPPLHSPPIVTILAPHVDQFIDGHNVLQVRGSAVDPDGSNQVSVKWRIGLKGNATDPEISDQVNFAWTPFPTVPQTCGGGRTKLCLYATDPDGTGSQCIEVYIFYPVC